MNDHRWSDVFRALESMTRFLSEAVRLFEEGGLEGGGRAAFQRQMVLMHTMELGYTSFETAVVRAMTMLGETPPTGPDWHAQLLVRAAAAIEGLRPPILPPDVARAATKVKSFRHWATRGYDSDFVASDAEAAVGAARDLLANARPAFDGFAATIDP